MAKKRFNFRSYIYKSGNSQVMTIPRREVKEDLKGKSVKVTMEVD